MVLMFLLIKGKHAKKKKIIKNLNTCGIETRPIISGNFLNLREHQNPINLIKKNLS